MKTKLLLICLSFSSISNADVVNFTTNNCPVDSSNNYFRDCIPHRKVVEIEQTSTDTLEIGVQDDAGDLFTYIMGGNNLIDYRVNPSSASPIGTSLLIFDKTDRLLVNASGFNGTNGVSAGEICRDKMLNEWGVKYQTYYNNKYGLGSNAPCDNEDQKKIYDEEFVCDPGFTESVNGKISLSFEDYKRQCKGNIVKNVCLKKTYTIDCRAYVKGAGCCGMSEFASVDDMNGINIPYSRLSFTGASCDYLSCGSGKNGLYYGTIFNNRDMNDVQNVNFCSQNVTNMPATAPTAVMTYGGGKTYSTDSENNYATFFNNLVVRDNTGATISASAYSLFLTNGPSVRNKISSCFGLNGSAITTKECAITNAPVTFNFKAVTNKQLVSDTVSLTIECNSGYMKVGGSCVPRNQTRGCTNPYTDTNQCADNSSQSSSNGGQSWSSCSANSCPFGCSMANYGGGNYCWYSYIYSDGD